MISNPQCLYRKPKSKIEPLKTNFGCRYLTFVLISQFPCLMLIGIDTNHCIPSLGNGSMPKYGITLNSLHFKSIFSTKINFISIPIGVMGINGGYFPSICWGVFSMLTLIIKLKTSNSAVIFLLRVVLFIIPASFLRRFLHILAII